MDLNNHSDFGGVSLRYIQFFIAAAEHQNFTRAAELLNTHQSQISRSILVLEQELEFQLFTREGKSVHLTPAGEELYKGWKNALYEFGFAVGNARTVAQSKRTGLRIADDFSMDKHRYLNPLVEEFANRYPDVDIQIEQFLADGTVDSVVNRRADVGFTVFYNTQFMKPHDIAWKLLISSPLYAWVHTSSKLYGKKALALKDLDGEPLAIVEQQKSLHYNEMFHSLFAQAAIEPVIEMRLPNLFSLEYYRRTGTLTYLANRIVAEPVREDVMAIPIEGTEVGLIAFWRKGKPDSPVKKRFLRLMDELLADGRIS